MQLQIGFFSIPLPSIQASKHSPLPNRTLHSPPSHPFRLQSKSNSIYNICHGHTTTVCRLFSCPVILWLPNHAIHMIPTFFPIIFLYQKPQRLLPHAPFPFCYSIHLHSVFDVLLPYSTHLFNSIYSF